MKKFKFQYIIAPIFLLIVCTLTVVCAAYNQEMLIDGEAHVRIHKDVRIMSIERYNATNGGYSTYNPKYSEVSTIMYDTLPNLNSTVTYKVKIRNNTNFYINVYDITSEVTNSITNSNVTYEFDKTSLNSTYGSDLINPSSESFIYITIKYKDGISLPENKANIATLKFKFSPIYASELSYENDTYTQCLDVQCAIDDIKNIINVNEELQSSYIVTYNYNNPQYQTVNYESYIDSGFIPDANYDFTINAVVNLSTSGKRYLLFGNYNARSHINLEIKTNNTQRLYVTNGTNIDRAGSVQVPAGQDMNLKFEWTASTYSYLYRLSNSNVTADLTGEAANIQNNLFPASLRVGNDYRTTSTFAKTLDVKNIVISREYPTNSQLSDLPVVVRPGYTFDGWFTAASGGTQISTSTTVTRNVTYYAHYTAE